jgi:hypothetical protein
MSILKSKLKDFFGLTCIVQMLKTLIINSKFKSISMLYNRETITSNCERKVESSLISEKGKNFMTYELFS